MDIETLIKKVKGIELKANRISKQFFAGSYHAAFKGNGMVFDKVREYEPGDDTRHIDWNVSARLNDTYVKVFEEERELTIMLVIDVSASSDFGTMKMTKRDLITNISALIAFSAIKNHDKIGALFYSEVIEKYIAPKKGKAHILYMVREMLTIEPAQKRTDTLRALRYLAGSLKKRAVVFMVSDFMDDKISKVSRLYSGNHDLLAIQVYDKREQGITDMGLVNLTDAETGTVKLVDFSSARVRNRYKAWWDVFNNSLIALFHRSHIDYVQIRTDDSYETSLKQMFAQRESRINRGVRAG